MKKSCYKTSLEFNKLLIWLNPINDPAGGLVMIDHTAMMAREY